MKLPVQAPAVQRGLSPLPVPPAASNGVQPWARVCDPGYTCCPSNINCLKCCNNANQVCRNGACADIG
jgi:hypothetical protein